MAEITKMNRGAWRATMAAMALSTAFGISAAQADSITAYTSYEEDEIAGFLERAKQDLPDLEVNVLRLSTVELHARILADA